MRKIFTLLVISLFMMTSLAFAGPAQPATDNYRIMNGSGGATGMTPPVEILLVRNGCEGADDTKLLSGDVVIWDTNSADGFTVSRCHTNLDQTYAGVLVTDILTPDYSGATLNPGSQSNWGYMAIWGYALAKTDSTGQSAGNGVVPNGATLKGSFVCKADGGISSDRGVNLAGGATDNIMPTWLRQS